MRLTAQTKKNAFTDAAATVLAMASKGEGKHLAMPALVRAIFGKNNHHPDIESLRETMKPNSRFSVHTLSASGYKLLCLIATLHDRNCIDQSGDLNVDYTKSVIRSLLGATGEIDFDESAMRNISFKDSQFVFGKNRIGEVHLTQFELLAEYQNVETHPKGEIQSHNLDLTQIEKISSISNVKAAVLGDTHGRVDLVLGWLIRMGAAEVKDALLLKKLIADLPAVKSPSMWRRALNDALTVTPNGKRIALTFIGDVFADRCHNDFAMACVLDFMHKHEIKFELVVGNHDIEFLRYYDQTPVELEMAKLSDQYGSLKNCLALFSEKDKSNASTLAKSNASSERNAFIQMVQESVIPHMVALGLSEDQRTIMPHAWIDDALFERMKQKAHCPNNLCPAEQVRHINDYFKREIFVNRKVLADISAAGHTEGIGIVMYKRTFNGEEITKARMPATFVKMVHGHDKGPVVNSKESPNWAQINEGGPPLEGLISRIRTHMKNFGSNEHSVIALAQCLYRGLGQYNDFIHRLELEEFVITADSGEEHKIKLDRSEKSLLKQVREEDMSRKVLPENHVLLASAPHTNFEGKTHSLDGSGFKDPNEKIADREFLVEYFTEIELYAHQQDP